MTPFFHLTPHILFERYIFIVRIPTIGRRTLFAGFGYVEGRFQMEVSKI